MNLAFLAHAIPQVQESALLVAAEIGHLDLRFAGVGGDARGQSGDQSLYMLYPAGQLLAGVLGVFLPAPEDGRILPSASDRFAPLAFLLDHHPRGLIHRKAVEVRVEHLAQRLLGFGDQIGRNDVDMPIDGIENAAAIAGDGRRSDSELSLSRW